MESTIKSVPEAIEFRDIASYLRLTSYGSVPEESHVEVSCQMKDNKTTTALYCRVAGSYENDAWEIENQRDTIRNFAEQMGFEDFAEHLDNGCSGLTFERPAFTRMDADIKAGRIDTVIVKSIDRVARSLLLANNWVSGLDALGVKIIAMDGSHEFSAH